MAVRTPIMWRTLILVCGVIVLCAGCKRTPPGEMMNEAKSAYDMKNFPMAIESYQKVLEEHPASVEAETAAFMIATIYNNDVRDQQKAVGAYRDYLARFPEGPRAPMALFLIGYLYNNELHNLDSAAAVYKEFLVRYPDHEMARSARFELENLGKPAEMLVPPDAHEPAPQAQGSAKERQ
jgi:TolA-binding protein